MNPTDESPRSTVSAETDGPETLSLDSRDLKADRIAELRRVFPEVFTEDRIDFDALKRSLGETVDPGKERFGLTWPGKADCMKVIQQPSRATLLPDREASVDVDTTRNVVIEGDNLEVLKLLQNSYYGKVKMIYIDPPYNTGNDFIYPDDYTDGLHDYLRYTGQVDGDGQRQSTNTDSSGRFHSKWLNMMYPRLFLARNLLRDDGVIFISIDQNEQLQVGQLTNIVFGEENTFGPFVWRRRSGSNDADDNFSMDHEYVVIARRSDSFIFGGLAKTLSNYTNPDNDPRGPWTVGDLTCNKTASQRPNLFYPITNPSTNVTYSSNPNRFWAFSRDRMQVAIDQGKIVWPKKTTGTPMYKRHKSEVQQAFKPVSSLIETTNAKTEEAATTVLRTSLNQEGTRELRDLFHEQVFDHPKPTSLALALMTQATNPSDEHLVLDFFAGSGTTGHAVMKLNAEDGGNRKYILVQLPEPVDNGGPYRTISEITRERLRRAGQKVRDDAAAAGKEVSGLDTGFQAYSLAESNFRQWQGDTESPQFREGQLGLLGSMEQQLRLLRDNVRPDRSPRAILTEIMLASGYALTDRVERIAVEHQHAYAVAGGDLLICIERRIELQTVRAMAALDPAKIVCLDASFAGNDQLRVNAAQAVRSRARQHDRTIAFQVV